MRYFNSVTNSWEDDQKQPEAPDMLSIPAGRASDPTGGNDIKMMSYLDSLKQQRQNYRDLSNSMAESPDQLSIGANIFNNQNQDAQKREPAVAQQDTAPIVKDYLSKKYNIAQRPSPIDVGLEKKASDLPQAQEQPQNKYDDAAYQKSRQEMKDRQDNIALSQLAAGIGDALARKDSTATDKYFQDLRGNIKDDTVGEFDRRKKASIEDAQRDPNSEASKKFRSLIKSTLPNIASMYGDKFDLITASDSKDILDYGKMREQIDARKQDAAQKSKDRQDMLDLKRDALDSKKSPDARMKSLSGTDKARFDNAVMALKGLDDMGAALDKGDNTFSMIGDNEYTRASRAATEAYGRMQSGGAINKDEEARFEKTLPGKLDSKDMQRTKILKQRDEMLSRLKTLGFTPEEIGYQPKDFNYGKLKQKRQAMPQTVVQNGHTYTLNPQTGEYE